MAQTINTNFASLNAQRNLSNSQQSLQVSMQRLSSGLRVNSAKDDAAGLAIAERMNSQAKGMSVAMRNANDAISMTQTAEGALNKVTDNFQRMRELAVQARNGTNSATDKDSMNKEFQELAKEINRVVSGTKFNGQAVLANANTVTYQVGAGTANTDTIDVVNTDLSADTTITDVTGTGVTATGAAVIDNTADTATLATVIDNIDTALTTISDQRATMGAIQSRFDAVISNLGISVENTTAARGRIVDTDFAAETANLSRSQILQQAGTAMLAQANQIPQGVLSLLR